MGVHHTKILQWVLLLGRLCRIFHGYIASFNSSFPCWSHSLKSYNDETTLLSNNPFHFNNSVKIALLIANEEFSAEVEHLIDSLLVRFSEIKLQHHLVAYFLSNDHSSLYYNQRFINYLLQKEGKFDFRCRCELKMSETECFRCLMERTLKHEDLLFILPHSLHDEDQQEMNPKFFFAPSEDVHSALECLNNGSSEAAVQTKPEDPKFASSLNASFHQDRDCQLWWPLNHTDILLYNYIPHHINSLRMKHTYLLKCTLQTDARMNLFPHSYTVLMSVKELHQGSDCDRMNTCNENLQEKYVAIEENNLQDKIEIHFVFDFSLEFRFSNPPAMTKQTIIQLSFEGKIIGNFIVLQNIIYLNSLSKSVPKEALSQWNHNLHWLSQVESRDDLGFLFSALYSANSSMIFVEVGVNIGNFARLMLHTWPSLSLYIGVDSWRSWPEEDYYDIANFQSALQHEQNYQAALFALADIPTETEKMIIRQDSITASRLFQMDSVDIVYIDAMHHYHAVYQDMLHWWPKIRRGGIMAGHDYLLDIRGNTIFTVKPAVEKFARERNLQILQTNDQDYPSFPSWFIIKE